jgi:cytochrome c556
MKSGLFAMVVAAGLLGCAGLAASEDAKPAAGEAAIGLSAQQIVSTRRAGMMLSGANMAAIKGVIDRAEDPKSATFATSALVAWSKALPGLFPAGSTTPGSKAKPEIWADRAGFEAAAKAFADDAIILRDFAKAGDAANFATQWAKLRSNCQACHDKYQAK